MARLAGFEPAAYGLEGYEEDFNMVKQQAIKETKKKKKPHETRLIEDYFFTEFSGF